MYLRYHLQVMMAILMTVFLCSIFSCTKHNTTSGVQKNFIGMKHPDPTEWGHFKIFAPKRSFGISLLHYYTTASWMTFVLVLPQESNFSPIPYVCLSDIEQSYTKLFRTIFMKPCKVIDHYDKKKTFNFGFDFPALLEKLKLLCK